jgi:hypothetical protein
MWLLRRASFLSSYTGKGFFFLYVAIPLLNDGWQEYKGCVLAWQSLPCPTTPTDDPGSDPADGWWHGSLRELLQRLFVHSDLVHFAVGLALFGAGILQLIFATTGPPARVGAPPPQQQGQQPPGSPRTDSDPTARAAADGLTAPLFGDAKAAAQGVQPQQQQQHEAMAQQQEEEEEEEEGGDDLNLEDGRRRQSSASSRSISAAAAAAVVAEEEAEAVSVTVKSTSWPPAWARAL